MTIMIIVVIVLLQLLLLLRIMIMIIMKMITMTMMMTDDDDEYGKGKIEFSQDCYHHVHLSLFHKNEIRIGVTMFHCSVNWRIAVV